MRRCWPTCGPVALRVSVMAIVGIEMLHDCLVLGLVAWNVALTSARYEASLKHEKNPLEVVAVTTEVILRSFDLMFTILLLYGVIKESRRHIMAWWWWTVSCLGLSVVLFIFVAIDIAKQNHLVGIPIVIFTVIICVSILFLVVVRTYVNYLERKEMLPTILVNEDDYDDDE